MATRERYSAMFLSGQHQSRLPDATARVPIFFSFLSKRAYSRRHSFPRGINPDGSVIKCNEADHLGGARCSGGIKTSSTARDRSIDYTPGKVRDPRSGWQAMCTDPSRSSKQYHATACASMHASGARANRSANHPRNARFSFYFKQRCVTSTRAFQTPKTRRRLSHFRPHVAGRGVRLQNSLVLTNNISRPFSHTSRRNETDESVFLSWSACSRAYSRHCEISRRIATEMKRGVSREKDGLENTITRFYSGIGNFTNHRSHANRVFSSREIFRGK